MTKLYFMPPLAIIRKIYFTTHTRTLRLHGGVSTAAETFTLYDCKKIINNGNKWAINFISYL